MSAVVDRRRRVALHEAGHATTISIYGEPFGATCLRVWIAEDGSGMAEYSNPDRLPTDLLAMIQFAGLSAERAAYETILVEDGHAPDLRDIRRLLGGDHRRWFAARDQADRLVARHWVEIQRVAEALEAAGELDRRDIEHIIATGHYCTMRRDMLVDC